MRAKPVALSILMLAVFASCSTTGSGQQQYVSSDPCAGKQVHPPDWVLNLPKDEHYLQAVGISGPTYYPEDAKKYAAENARAELARVLGVEVKSFIYIWQREHGVQDIETRVETMSLSFTDEVLHGSEIVAYWVDVCGVVSKGVRGTTYAWARMPKNQARIRELAQKFLSGKGKETESQKTEKRQKIQNVQERSKKAFEELESEEEKR